MSGVLFHGKDASEGDRKGKGKEREREREREEANTFVHYGTQLPKALEVLGQAFDSTSLNEKCRVVVIGVAGWSPGACVGCGDTFVLTRSNYAGAVTRTLAGGVSAFHAMPNFPDIDWVLSCDPDSCRPQVANL